MSRTPGTTDDRSALLRRMMAGDPQARAAVLTAAAEGTDPALIVTAAVLTGEPARLHTARALARTSRERQLVELAAAQLSGRSALFDALVREHLTDFPDDLLACWLAGTPNPGPTARRK